MTPGIYRGLPSEEYHAAPGCNFSRLVRLRTGTPADLKEYIDSPPEATSSMDLGAAIHDALLLPEEFEKRWVVADRCSAIKGDGEQCENPGVKYIDGSWYCGVHSKGKTSKAVNVLSQDEARTIDGIRRSAERHTYAKRLFSSDVEHELSLFWNDAQTGLLCKARIDLYNRSRCALVDLKTTSNGISYKEFRRTIETYGLWLQMAHYKAALEACGFPVDFEAWITVQVQRPHGIMVWEADHADLVLAESERRMLLEIYAECEKSGVWPGYEERVGLMSMSPWEANEIEARIEEVYGERYSAGESSD